MGRESKQAESDEASGAPEWMVTFSDCMTLLLTFFVLLLSFSSFDDRIFRSLKVVYSRALTSINPLLRSDRDAFLYLPPVRHIAELDEGSEKPTSIHGLEDALMKESKLVNLRSGMTFLISSNEVFWGNGMILSPEGCHIMDTLALFLKKVPSRIVISENGQTNNQDSECFGLPRAWATMEYLVTKHDLDRKRFSISAAGTLTEGRYGSAGPGSERKVEIVLLERNIYN